MPLILGLLVVCVWSQDTWAQAGNGVKSSCVSPKAAFGKSATVTCTFSENLNQTFRTFRVYHYDLGPTGKEEENTVLECLWRDVNQLQCNQLPAGYEFDANVTEQLTVVISKASPGFMGKYRCVAEPSYPRDIKACFLQFKGDGATTKRPTTIVLSEVIDATDIPGKPEDLSGDEDDESNGGSIAAIIIIILIILILIAGCILLFIFRRRVREFYDRLRGRHNESESSRPYSEALPDKEGETTCKLLSSSTNDETNTSHGRQTTTQLSVTVENETANTDNTQEMAAVEGNTDDQFDAGYHATPASGLKESGASACPHVMPRDDGIGTDAADDKVLNSSAREGESVKNKDVTDRSDSKVNTSDTQTDTNPPIELNRKLGDKSVPEFRRNTSVSVGTDMTIHHARNESSVEENLLQRQNTGDPLLARSAHRLGAASEETGTAQETDVGFAPESLNVLEWSLDQASGYSTNSEGRNLQPQLSTERQPQVQKAEEPRECPRPNLNYLFYTNQIPSRPDGDYIDDIHQYWWNDHDLIEKRHQYIQWLFPNPEEPSQNQHAQKLYPHEAEAIQKDKKAFNRFAKSYQMMLHFFGLQLTNKKGDIERGKNWKKRFQHLQDPRHTHNYLRITRILICLGEMGLENFKVRLVQRLVMEGIEGNLSRTAESCRKYWIPTVLDPVKRQELAELAKNLPA